MENSENKAIITVWDNINFNSKEIGVIFITENGHILYGRVNNKVQDYKYRIGHTTIFETCVKELGINLSPTLDQMGYAWGLASNNINIISLQILTPNELLIVMNKNSNDTQLSLLNAITEYFDKYNYLFTADICSDNNVESIYNDFNNSHEFGLELEEFNRQLGTILNKSNSNNSQK